MKTTFIDVQWSDEQVHQLRQFAAGHGFDLQFDVTDDGETFFADLYQPGSATCRFTVLRANGYFVLNDDEGYALCKAPALAQTLAALEDAVTESAVRR